MPLPKSNTYTIEDIYALPEGKRAELIDGQIYDMAPPSPMHQELVQQLSRTIGNYIEKKGGPLITMRGCAEIEDKAEA